MSRFRYCPHICLLFFIFSSAACSKYVPVRLVEERLVPKKGELTAAASRGDLAEVKSLLAAGSGVNENLGNDTKAVTPLLAALAKSNYEIASYLLSQGANPEVVYSKYSARDMARLLNRFDLFDSMDTKNDNQ